MPSPMVAGRAPRTLPPPASLLLPAGIYGPGFLIFKNYFVIKDYNFSDLYVLFVGHLADRIADPRPFERPWGKVVQLRTADLEEMQQHLAALGLYRDKLDGKAGMKTRLALGAYQKANRPDARLLADRGGARSHAAPARATLRSARPESESTSARGRTRIPSAGLDRMGSTQAVQRLRFNFRRGVRASSRNDGSMNGRLVAAVHCAAALAARASPIELNCAFCSSLSEP